MNDPWLNRSLVDCFLTGKPSGMQSDSNELAAYVWAHESGHVFALRINVSVNVEPRANGALLQPLQGGRLGTDKAFVVHPPQPGSKWRTTAQISSSISITTSHDVVEAILAGAGPNLFMFCIGYEAWSSELVANEIALCNWQATGPHDGSMLHLAPGARGAYAAGLPPLRGLIKQQS